MGPWEQAKAFGLKAAWEEMHGEKTYGMATWIAERVYVQGRPKKHPSTEAIRQLVEKMIADGDWFPGKVYGSLGGRPEQIPDSNKAAMARSAMAMKERGIEPTYALVIAHCPNASVNPVTGEPVSKQDVVVVVEPGEHHVGAAYAAGVEVRVNVIDAVPMCRGLVPCPFPLNLM